MDRRQFAKLIGAAVMGVSVVDELLSTGPMLFGQPVTTAARPTATSFPVDFGGFYVPREFADQIEADILLYGNAYIRRDGTRVHPLKALARHA